MSEDPEGVDNQNRSAIGLYRPPHVSPLTERPDPSIYRGLVKIPGLSASVSDVLDDLGYQLAVPSTIACPLISGESIVGPALTLRYLPERRSRADDSRLAHSFVFAESSPGDVVVIEGDPTASFSVLGGLAAANAKKAGLAGVLVDGAVRDVDQIIGMQLNVWSRGGSCITGRGRLEGYSVNQPVSFCGVQVHAGDIVVADESGICFIPSERLKEVCQRVLAIYEEELKLIQE